MKKIPQPSYTADATLDLCRNQIKNAATAAAIAAQRSVILSDIFAYEAHAKLRSTHLVPLRRDLPPLKNKEVKLLYKEGLLPKTSPGRAIYDHIMTLAENAQCPHCAQNQVGAIDHYLPQSRYASLVVAPANLSPICSDCNRAKLARVPKTAGEQTLHPYFDDFDNERWLFCTRRNTHPLTVEFRSDPPRAWSSINRQRVAYHFTTLKLGQLYATSSISELQNIKYQLDALHSAGGAKIVSEHLSLVKTSCQKVLKNSWRSALYETLAADTTFCDGEFRHISA